MKKFLLTFVAFTTLVGLYNPPDCPAPLIWRKDEGWQYEREGVSWPKTPKEQLAVCQEYQKRKNYGTAAAGYRRLIKLWPTSMYAADARLGLAECLVSKGYLFKGFKEYQTLIAKHPGSEHFETALQRQYEIGNMFFAGARDKAWGIKMFKSLDKAVEIYEQVIKNGPYSKAAPDAQFKIGLTREKQQEFNLAVAAYEKLLENYPKSELAEQAQFEIGEAYRRQSARAEYDQNAANQAVTAYTEYLVRYPDGEKAASAKEYRQALTLDQARGLFTIGRFYEKKSNPKAALIYYNEVVEKSPQSDWARQAQQKIAQLEPRVSER